MKTFIRIVATILIVAGAVRAADFDPFTETKQEYDARAQWMRDAKLGIFIHWNPSALAAREISFCRNDIGAEKYDNLYKEFKAEKFNAKEWIKLFEETGAKYANFVPKHHDGFCMFDTKTANNNVMRTPFGRDYIKEVAEACRGSEIKFCLYYSVCEWTNPKWSDSRGADLREYIETVFKPHMTELLTHYGPVGNIWFDGVIPQSWTHAFGREMYDYTRRLQPQTLMGNRIDQTPPDVNPSCIADNELFDSRLMPGISLYGGFYPPQLGGVGDFQAREMSWGQYYTDKAWDSCYQLRPRDGECGGWSYIAGAPLRSLSALVHWEIQCISRDGNMLLGLGPLADGTIAPDTAARMRELGAWMKGNGEAIYKTRGGPWLPGEWGGSTRKGNKIYLFVEHLAGDTFPLPALPVEVKSARLLHGDKVTLTRQTHTVQIRVPKEQQTSMVTIVELTMAGDVMALGPMPVPLGGQLLSQGKPVEVSSVWPGREAELNPKHITDGDDGTLWATEEKARSGQVTVDLGSEQEVAQIEYVEGYNRTQTFTVEAEVGGQWTEIAQGGATGGRIRLNTTPVTARKVRLNILKASDTPVVNEFRVFSPAAYPWSLGLPVEVSSVWPGRDKWDLRPENITDNNPRTVWAAEEEARTASVTIDLGKQRTVATVLLSDAPHKPTRAFDVEAQVNGAWKQVAAGTTIGEGLRLTFPPVQAQKLRLNIRQATDTPVVNEFQLFGR